MSSHSLIASMCNDCDGLLRKPHTVAAHQNLKDGASKKRPSGTVQMFSCSRCGTHWERFRRKAGAAAAAVWRTI